MPGRIPPHFAEEAEPTGPIRPCRRQGAATSGEALLPMVLSRRTASDFLGEVRQELCSRSRARSAFAEAEEETRHHAEEVKHEATRARSKAGRVEERSVWAKGQAKSSYRISKRANRVAFGALLFTIMGVAIDTVSNVITVFTTKRMMNDLEDEAAQALARRRRSEQR
ncbi:unnamed protein product [Symbiodinium natans]|uniref:Uncharacterized protein n=1 Tax=Symbiodinium natans TaxID=878477 RepID=A0A812G669_9DINO|nr:unnamed protein product [Symbiodinium natans]